MAEGALKRWDGSKWVIQSGGGGVTSEGFLARRTSGSPQSLSAATETKIIFDDQVRDEGDDYDTSTGEWTVPATGWYDVRAQLNYASLADGDRILAAIYVNGSRFAYISDATMGGANNGMGGGSTLLYLNSGDVVTVYGFRSSAGDVAGGNNTYFSAGRLVAASSGASLDGVKATRTTAQSIPDSTFTAIELTSENWDTDAYHDTATNPSRITIPSGKDGKFRLEAGVAFDSNGTGRRIMSIRKNGTEIFRHEVSPTSGTTLTTIMMALTADAVATDHLEMYVFQSSGGALSTNVTTGNTFLSAHRLGA